MLLVVAMEMRCLLSFECSSNAPLSYEGNHRDFRASGVLTCSWVLTVPENYTVKLTITQMNVDSGGNFNCFNDYLQIRDGANSSLLAQICNSYPSSSVFRSSGTQMWVEYKSTQALNSFEASFKRLLNPSFCPRNVIANDTSGLLTSPFYPNNFPNDMDCSWNITGQAESRFVLIFRFLCLGICTSSLSQPCACDSLEIGDVFGARKICPQTELIPFISVENKISLSLVTDEQNSAKGFLAKYDSVFRLEECASMTQLTNTSGWFSSPGFPSSYPNNVECAWTIPIPPGLKIYLTFLEFDVEECGASCSCDYVEVAFTKAQSSQKKCGRIASGGWVLKNAINDEIVITFKSDGQGRLKGFEAVYTLVPQDAWESVPSAFCPWKDPAPTTEQVPTVLVDDASTERIPTAAIAQTARPSSDDSSATVTDSTTKRSSEGRGAVVCWRRIASLLIIYAFIAL